MECQWCNEPHTTESTQDCYWTMPDGKRTLRIMQIPAVDCPQCGVYISEPMNQKVEENLIMADLTGYPDTLTYDQILHAPKIRLFDLK
ncbi:UNVERIFIED_CONTAM: putative YokU family protein [Brevibacillus sp. OAP136]